MARKTGQIIRRESSTWLVGIYVGRDPETQRFWGHLTEMTVSSSIWITSGLPVTRHRAQPPRNPVILTVSVARRKMRSPTENLNLFRKNRETFTSRLTSDNRSQYART